MSIIVCDPVMKVVNVKAEYNIIKLTLHWVIFVYVFRDGSVWGGIPEVQAASEAGGADVAVRHSWIPH